MELIKAYRAQGASLTDVNNQLLLRQTLPADLQTPEIFEAIAADPEALQAITSNPKALEAFAAEYRAALASQSPYYDQAVPSTGYYGGPSSGMQGDAMQLLSQPVNPANSKHVLNQSPDFFRQLALAGGDWNPYNR